MSLPQDLLMDVLERLQATPDLVPLARNVRIDRRTIVTRDNAPAVHIIPGELTPGKETDCRQDWTMLVTVAAFVRDDETQAAVWPLVGEIVLRIAPLGSPSYPHKARFRIVRIRPEYDVADGDAQRTDVECQFDFSSAPWDLETEGEE